MHLAPLIRDLSIILGIAGITTFIFRKIKQPVVLGYLVAGFIVGPHTPPFPLVTDLPNIQVWAELGIIFVMFTLGLDFSFHKLVRVGRFGAVTALGEVAFMLFVGYSAGKFLGWGTLDCFFLSGALAISSTTIIFKAFDDLGLRSRPFADHVFGILIVEDLAAILLLVALSIVASTQTLWDISLLIATFRLVVVVGAWFLVGYFVIPTLVRRIGRWMDAETWTVLSVGLCLLMVVAATQLGYSPALGAFIMGSILAETREATRIEHLMQPLRDVFAAVFFVSVGMLVDPHQIGHHLPVVLFLTVVVILGKITGVTFSSLLSGQPLKASVRAGFSLSQIGEFSFIIAGLGSQLGATSGDLFPIAVAVSTLTAFTTPYLIRLSGPFADFVDYRLPEEWRESLTEYSNRLRAPSETKTEGDGFATRSMRFLLNAILVSLGLLTSRYVTPSLGFATWAMALALVSPFVWGMFFAFRQTLGSQDRSIRLPGLISRFVTLLWVALLSVPFFENAFTYTAAMLGVGVLFAFTRHLLGKVYQWFERQLLGNLTGTAAHAYTLAPWDLRLFKVTLHPNSSLMGSTIAGNQLRQRFGLNVVALQRGNRSLPAPGANEMLHPMDTVLVLGTEEGVAAFRTAAETPATMDAEASDLSDYHLERLYLGPDSPYVGKTIRHSGIRETRNSLIVGVENGTDRTTNPDPNRPLRSGDVLWLVTDH